MYTTLAHNRVESMAIATFFFHATAPRWVNFPVGIVGGRGFFKKAKALDGLLLVALRFGDVVIHGHITVLILS